MQTFFYFRLTGAVAVECTIFGPDTLFTNAEELLIVDYVICCSCMGCGLMKGEFLDEIEKILCKDGWMTPNGKFHATHGWTKRFLDQHPELHN